MFQGSTTHPVSEAKPKHTDATLNLRLNQPASEAKPTMNEAPEIGVLAKSRQRRFAPYALSFAPAQNSRALVAIATSAEIQASALAKVQLP